MAQEQELERIKKIILEAKGLVPVASYLPAATDSNNLRRIAQRL